MRVFNVIFAIYLLSPALFSGCGPNNAGVGIAATPTPQSADSQGNESGGVLRNTPDPTARAVPGESRVIATRQGPDGLEVDLARVGFAGDLMTIELRYRNPTAKDIWVDSFSLDQVSFIDDATSKRYGVV